MITHFIGYHNGGYGISHGAYMNRYHYRDSILFSNREGGVALHAVSRAGTGLRLENLLINCAGLSSAAIEVLGHVLPGEGVTQIVACRFSGYTGHGITLTGTGSADRATNPDRIDVIGCTFGGNKLWLGDEIHEDSLVRLVSTRILSARHRSQQPGRLRTRWNARVTRNGQSEAVATPTTIRIGLRASA